MDVSRPHQASSMNEREGDTEPASLPWENLSAERGMPGRSQQGQLLSVEDEPSEELDSDGDVQRPLLATHEAAKDAQKMLEPTGSSPGRPPPPVAIPLAQQARADQAAEPGKDESGTDTDEDGELIRAKAKAAQEKVKTVPKRRVPGKTRPGAGITLGLLIREGIIWPGEDVLSVEYKSVMTHATLTSDGQIICKINGGDMTFESPSAFSIFLKRMVNPNRKADDGWKTVKFNGRFLETYKLELAKRRLATTGTEAEETANPHPQPAAKRPKLDTQGLAKERDQTQHPVQRANGLDPVEVLSPTGSNLEDEGQMIPCERYRGEPGGTSSGCQPFRVTIAPAAIFFMDLHSHLSNNEVIGLLGGSWDSDQRILRVEQAFPVQEVRTDNDVHTVEMEAKDRLRVEDMISTQHAIRCVGWYHSHPHAEAHPSTTDIVSQIKEQQQHRVPGTTDEPFIGAIVGPYPSRGDRTVSDIAYFSVEYPLDQELAAGADPISEGCLPMEIQVEEEHALTTDAKAVSTLQSEIRLIAQRCARSSRRADILGGWDDRQSRLDKLKTSLAARLPSHWTPKVASDLLVTVEAVVSAAWSFFNKAADRKTKAEDEELEISDITESDPIEAASDPGEHDDTAFAESKGNGLAPSSQPGLRETPSDDRMHAADDLVGPAHLFFDNGADLGSGQFGDEYESTFLSEPISYQGGFEHFHSKDATP